VGTLEDSPLTRIVRVVSCPQCGAPVRWEPASRFRPFCSERCQLVDLGAWASESYRVPVVEDPDEPGVGENEEKPAPS
jgi:endogenous inhibitor of DNA gyrase (YacG/DUF329 family)